MSGYRGPLEKITVNLTQRSQKALELAAELGQGHKTDTINKALQVHAYLLQVEASGGVIYVRETPDGEMMRVRIF